MTDTYYHGTRRAFAFYPGICMTSSDRAAASYGAVHELAVDLDGLTVRRVSGYDAERNSAPGDTAEELARMLADGVDAVEYDDRDEHGRDHDCLRLLSSRALARVVLVAGADEDG